MNDTINRYLAILCYPFVSLDFFFEDYFEEIIKQKKEEENNLKQVEARLREKVIHYIQAEYSIYSYDEIYLYLDKCYLYDLRILEYKNAQELYVKYIKMLTQSMISQRDGKITFKYWKNSQDEKLLGGFGDENKIFLFHSMNMHMPLDFIALFYIAQHPQNDIESLNKYYGQIEVADQQLDMVLKNGVAENHLHKGAALSFLEVWEVLMLPISSASVNDIKRMQLRFSDGKYSESEILCYVFSAAISRVWISISIWSIKNRKMEMFKLLTGEKRLNNLIDCFINGEKLRQFYKENFSYDTEKKNKNSVISYYQELWDSILVLLPEISDGKTLIREVFSVPDKVHTTDENIFLFYGMRFLSEYSELEQTMEHAKILKCLLQYLRIKNYLFSRVVQKKTIHGLDYFQKYYNRDSDLAELPAALRRGDNSIAVAGWKQIMRKQFQNEYLKKIEFRARIQDNEAQFRKNVGAFLKAYREIIEEDYCQKVDGNYRVYKSFPKVGLVFHLIKRKDECIPEKCFLDGEDNPERIQYGRLEQQYCEQIKLMRSVRDTIPGLDSYIVGIDAASLENATPVWVFVKAYEEARDSSIEKIGYAGMGTQSIRFTFHAGEDFRHILSGIRRMDEAVTFLKFHAGDRIGHGTALGISSERWRRSNPFVVLPRMEALENYLWAYYVLSQDTIHFQSTLMAYIEHRVYELARDIYGKSQGISIQVLVEGYKKTFHMPTRNNYSNCMEAEDVGFCANVQKGNCDEIIWNEEKIALARHCKRFLKEMERPITYEVTQQDVEITTMLQKILKGKLSRKGIIVEVNPSSNLAIGEVDRLTENQVYQLNQLGQEENIFVCINSDDPMVFNTNVSTELSYIYYGMLYNSVSRENALNWIDKVRKCGMEASFIQMNDSDQQIYEKLKIILDNL